MFSSILNRASTDDSIAVYTILSKNDSSMINDDDLEKINSSLINILGADDIDKEYVIEESLLSLYEIYSNNSVISNKELFIHACSIVFNNIENSFSENEINSILNCVEIFREFQSDSWGNCQSFYDKLKSALDIFNQSRYIIGVFCRKALDLILLFSNFNGSKNVIRDLSLRLINLDIPTFEKACILNNQFLRF